MCAAAVPEVLLKPQRSSKTEAKPVGDGLGSLFLVAKSPTMNGHSAMQAQAGVLASALLCLATRLEHTRIMVCDCHKDQETQRRLKGPPTPRQREREMGRGR